MAELSACLIEPLDNSACQATVAWITSAGGAPAHQHVQWLLAYCYGGVIWGRFDGAASKWQLASGPFPKNAPHPAEENLLELRVFGPELEVLIWREGRSFRGRRLSDQPCGEDHLRHIDESRILLCDRLLEGPADGFSRVGNPTGAEQVVPVEVSVELLQKSTWPLRLHVRHYLESDDETGAVRIAATRLVRLEVKRS